MNGRLQIGEFFLDSAKRNRHCRICDKPITKGQLCLKKWSSLSIHVEHFNEEILNEIRFHIL
jgi:hypothetical protein